MKKLILILIIPLLLTGILTSNGIGNVLDKSPIDPWSNPFDAYNTSKSKGDSMDISFVGNWPFGPTYTSAVDTVREILFLGTGGAIQMLDISDSVTPTLLSEIRCRGLIVKMRYDYQNQYLIVCEYDNGISIWDVSDLNNYVKISTIKTTDRDYDFDIIGDSIYIASNTSGLRIYNIADIYSPQPICSLSLSERALSIEVNNGYAYIGTDTTGLMIADLASINNPNLVGDYRLRNPVTDIEVKDSILFLAYYGKVYSFDVSDPENPFILDDFIIGSSTTTLNDITLMDDKAFCGCNVGYAILDITNPDSMFAIAYNNSLSGINCITNYNNISYLSCVHNGLEMLSMSDTSNAEIIGSHNVYQARELIMRDSLAFISSYYGLLIFDCSDPSNPCSLSMYDENVYSCYIKDSIAYLAVGNNGLDLVNISDSLNPYLINNIPTKDTAYQIVLVDSLAYVADCDSGLTIVNISNPDSLSIIGNCNTPGSAIGINVSSGYAYIADGSEGLRIIDVNNPEHPIERASYASTYAENICIVDTVLYLQDKYDNLVILNISNPLQPVFLSQYKASGYANDVFVSDGSAYLLAGYMDGWLDIIDVSDIYNPHQIGYTSLTGIANAIFCKDDNAYVVANNAGLLVLDISEYISPHVISHYDVEGYNIDIVIKDNFAYLANNYTTLTVLNLDDIANPYKVFGDEKYIKATQILLDSNNHAFISDYNGGIDIYDITNPEMPLNVNYYSAGISKAWGIAMKRDFLYCVDDSDGGIIVLNLSDPTAISEIGRTNDGSKYGLLSTPLYLYSYSGNKLFQYYYDYPSIPDFRDSFVTYDYILDLVFDGSQYLYVADYDSGITVLNENLQEINNVSINGEPIYYLNLVDDYLYAINFDSKLHIFDISDGANPLEVGYYDIPRVSMGGYVKDNYIFVSNYWSGVQIYNNLLLSGLEKEYHDRLNAGVNHYILKYNIDQINIFLGMKNDGHINISLYDKLGRQCTKLIDKKVESGYTTVSIDKSQYPSGQYFVKGMMGETEVSVKVVIIK